MTSRPTPASASSSASASTRTAPVTYEGVWVDDIIVESACAPQPCLEDDDCVPVDCVLATCVDGGCSFALQELCCFSNAECDDGNPCTSEVCTSQVCIYTPVDAPRLLHERRRLRRRRTTAPSRPATAIAASGAASRPAAKTAASTTRTARTGDDCTEDRCAAHRCVFTPLCCASDDDCDDGDVCTIDACGDDSRCAYELDTGNPRLLRAPALGGRLRGRHARRLHGERGEQRRRRLAGGRRLHGCDAPRRDLRPLLRHGHDLQQQHERRGYGAPGSTCPQTRSSR